MQQMKTEQQIRGIVEAANPKGIRVEGQWWNFSRFAEVDRPDRGQQVEMLVDATDKGNFIRALRIMDEPAMHQNGSSTNSPPVTEPPTKDRIISRLALIKAASEWLAPRPETQVEDILTAAEAFEEWVLR